MKADESTTLRTTPHQWPHFAAGIGNISLAENTLWILRVLVHSYGTCGAAEQYVRTHRLLDERTTLEGTRLAND